jgi:CubicO group peptidase (beta-lactamase class C family)
VSHPAQSRIQSLLDRLTASGIQRGAQVAVYLKGKLIVDAWSGVADPAGEHPIHGDTLFPVFSVSKGMTATLLHQLVERDLVSYDTPINEVWPEFAVHGKDGITLRHCLNHTAGLAHLPGDISHSEIADWSHMCRLLADARPLTPPGAQGEYHAVTFGWLCGEVACRITGRDFQTLLADEISRPLGMGGSLFMGLPTACDALVATLEEPSAIPPAPGEYPPSPIPASLQPLHTFMNRPDMRRACVPASSGIMTARAIARHYAALLPDGVDGVELLPPHRVHLATELQVAPDATGADFRRYLGYALAEYPGAGPRAFGHGGYGGSTGFADPARGLAVGLTRNLFNDSDLVGLVLAELSLGSCA